MAQLRGGLDELNRRERKAKAVLLATLRAAGGEMQNRTNLFKVFWMAHLAHMAHHGWSLTDWKIVHLPRGPGPNNGKDLLAALESDGFIVQQEVDSWGRTAKSAKIANHQKTLALIESELNAAEIESVELMTKAAANSTASALSDWSHEVSRAWNRTVNGQTMDIYLDLLADEDEFAALQEQLGKDVQVVDQVFGKP